MRIDKEHISFEVSSLALSSCSPCWSWGYLVFGCYGPFAEFLQTAKIGSLADVNDSQDAEGLRVFYYLVQDLKVGLCRLTRSNLRCRTVRGG